MGVQSILPLEPSTTQSTRKLFISVDDFMSLQMIAVAKSLSTCFTGIFRTFTVLSLLMLLQKISGSEGNATNITWNLLRVLLMNM